MKDDDAMESDEEEESDQANDKDAADDEKKELQPDLLSPEDAARLEGVSEGVRKIRV